MREPPLLHRRAVRALMLADDQLLLMEMNFAFRDAPIWIAPGGGLLPGESAEAGLRREILEETGQSGIEVGPLVWQRQFDIATPKQTIRQDELYFLVRTP